MEGRAQAWLVESVEQVPGVKSGIWSVAHCKKRTACHEETLTGNAKRGLEVCWELRPYITTGPPRGVVCSSHCWLQGSTPSLGSGPWWTWLVGRIKPWPGRLLRGSRERMRVWVHQQTEPFARTARRWDVLKEQSGVTQAGEVWAGLNRRKCVKCPTGVTKPLENWGRGLDKQACRTLYCTISTAS